MAPGTIPQEFLDRLRRIVPAARYDEVVRSFAVPVVTGFRVNTLKAAPEAVIAELQALGLHLHRVDWKADAFWVAPEERALLLSAPAYAEQRLYVQNLASMVPPLLLAARPGERVLDLAAAPGSKTLQLACQMQNTGEIAAVEVVKSRFFKLRANLEAQGATCVRSFLQDGTKVWRYRPEHFDRVLLDAPCSTEGRFRADEPETYAYWNARKIREMARKQRRLLYAAVQCLRVGGLLVYSTCTFAPEENEAVLDKTLRQFGDALCLEPIDLALDNTQPPLACWQGKAFVHDLSPARRLLPTPAREGFFVARVRKVQRTVRLRGPGSDP